MVSFIRQFFSKYIESSPEAEKTVHEHSLQVATAVLLTEMMRADGTTSSEEINKITQAVKTRFGLSEEESSDILNLADHEISKSTGFYEFTSLLNKELEYEKKVHIVEQIWEVGFADSRLNKYEEHMVRKISDLLYVTHKDFIEAKLRVKKRENI
jgi:uncharacterized tellurite resistance protein B-like protein